MPISYNQNHNRIEVFYRDSNHLSSETYVRKYYLSIEDKVRLFSIDLRALNMLAWRDENFDVIWEMSLRGTNIPDKLPDITIRYIDLNLEKLVDAELVRRGLAAIAAYWQDARIDNLSLEEINVALNFNNWLRDYEKTLAVKCIEIESSNKKELRGSNSLLVDYEINMELDFYLREDDPFCENRETDCHDRDDELARMCTMNFVSLPSNMKEYASHDYYGIGDERDHNDCPYLHDFKHSYLFHELISHRGVPVRHLKRIGTVWADIIETHQSSKDFGTTCKTETIPVSF